MSRGEHWKVLNHSSCSELVLQSHSFPLCFSCTLNSWADKKAELAENYFQNQAVFHFVSKMCFHVRRVKLSYMHFIVFRKLIVQLSESYTDISHNDTLPSSSSLRRGFLVIGNTLKAPSYIFKCDKREASNLQKEASLFLYKQTSTLPPLLRKYVVKSC